MDSKKVKLRDVEGRLWSEGEIFFRTYTKPERTKRAVKFAALSVAMAFVTLFVPVVHFVSVPLFILISPFVFSYFMGQEVSMTGGVGKCPHCGQEFKIESGSMKLPFEDLCNYCKKQVWIEESFGVK